MRYKLLSVWILIFIIGGQIGFAQENQPQFGEITFALDVTLQGSHPMTPLERFPAGITFLIAVVDVEGLQEGNTITSQWVYDGQVQVSSDYVHQRPETTFRLTTPLANQGGIGVGQWTLNLLLGGVVVQSGTFDITEEPLVLPIRFGLACGTYTGELLGHVSQYQSGTQQIFAQLRFFNFPPQTPVVGKWRFNRQDIEGPGLPVETTLSGNGRRCLRVGGSRALNEGVYELEVYTALDSLTKASVGLGDLEDASDEAGD